MNSAKHTKRTKRFNRRPIIVALIIIFLLATAAVGLVYKSHLDSDPTGYGKEPQIDYSPATEEEKADSEQRKKDTSQKADTPPATGATISVTPVIVDASQYGDQVEVRAYTSGIFEEGGTCTITFTKGTLKITKQVPASEDATTTRCTNLNVSRTEFSQPGQWTTVVSYSSPTAQGSSQARTFEVQ